MRSLATWLVLLGLGMFILGCAEAPTPPTPTQGGPSAPTVGDTEAPGDTAAPGDTEQGGAMEPQPAETEAPAAGEAAAPAGDEAAAPGQPAEEKKEE